MLAFLELTSRFKNLKASRKFGVLCSFRYESNQNSLFYKNVSGNFEIFILHRFKAFFASLFGLSLAEGSKIAITFKYSKF